MINNDYDEFDDLEDYDDDIEELKECINSNFTKLFSIIEKMNIKADVDEDI